MVFGVMRLPRRIVLKSGLYFHMMWRAHNREFILRDHREKLCYLRAVRDDYLNNCNPEEFAIHGYTMMSNHGHVNGSVGEDPSLYSNHMRRAHSRFGMSYNKRHDRLGKVAHDRPKIKASEDGAYAIEVMLYDLFNPVRAGIIPTPTDIKWRLFSTARYLAYGEENEFTCMITLPEWYLRLGETAAQRQRKFRQMLDQYALERGLKRDPKKARGLFVGGEPWVREMRRLVSDWVRARRKQQAGTGADPPAGS
jgi:REP element-mobilizing transposase RayT